MAGNATLIRGDKTHNGLSKVDRYGWELKDARGTFMEIDKCLLNVDRSEESADGYQRDLRDERALSLARSWSWTACGCLLVARRPDGSFWIIDGQHRHAGAEKRTDIETLPCLVFDALEKKEEALGFLHSNTNRRPMRAIEKFRAMIISGDADAIGVDEIVRQCGFQIGKANIGGVECVACLINCHRSNPAILETVLLVCSQISKDSPNERIVGGLFYLETFLLKRKLGTVSSRHNLDSLKAAGVPRIMQSIGEACAFYAKGGPKVYAEGLVRLLNHKRSSRRLPSVFASEPDA